MPRQAAPMPVRHVTAAERRARLARRHLLTDDGRSRDAVGVVRALGALHATDPATVYLSVAARLVEPSLAATETMLLTDRSAVRHHAMRRTVWVMEPDTLRAAHASCTDTLARREWILFERMLADNGVTDSSAWLVAAKRDALEAIERLGTATARQIATTHPHLNVPLQLAVGKSYAGVQGAHTRLIQNLGFDGTIVRTKSTGSWVSGEYSWASARLWIDGGIADASLPARHGAAALASIYLRAFGPATAADLQWWAGWSAGITNQALTDVGAVPVSIEVDQAATHAPGWLLPDDVDPVEPTKPWATILPSLDPTVMGWKQREWYTGPHGALGVDVFDRNGNAGNSIMANGTIVGSWAHRPDGSVATHLFEPLPRALAKQLDSSIDRYLATTGDTVVRPRYPAPMQAALLNA